MVLTVLLVLWALAGLGCGVLWADWLNRWKLPGTAYPMGFWFAQQGSIIIFVVLIFAYCVVMNWLDARHRAEMEVLGGEAGNDEAGRGEGDRE